MENATIAWLERNNIQQETFIHPAIFTVQQAEELNISHPGAHTKNLFLKTKKADQYVLVCIESQKRLSINAFGKEYGFKDLTFGSPEELEDILGVTPGSVGLFGLVHYAVQKEARTMPALSVFIDEELWNAEKVGWHPGTNTATTVISHQGLEDFLGSVEISPVIFGIKQTH